MGGEGDEGVRMLNEMAATLEEEMPTEQEEEELPDTEDEEEMMQEEQEVPDGGLMSREGM